MTNKRDDLFDSEKRSPGYVCCLCECPPGFHVCFFKCPIFDGQYICSECCFFDVLREGVEKKFSERLGYTITREEITDFCRKCGRNHAVEDSVLADELEWNSENPKDAVEETDHEEDQK